MIAGCIRLARGDDADPALILALGGPAAGRFLAGPPRPDNHSIELPRPDNHLARLPRPDSYWLRVWGLRGLLWVWDDSAAPVAVAALADEAWRVREMAAKVAARHLVGEALPVLASIRGDPVERVRRATDRAIRVLTGAGA